METATYHRLTQRMQRDVAHSNPKLCLWSAAIGANMPAWAAQDQIISQHDRTFAAYDHKKVALFGLLKLIRDCAAHSSLGDDEIGSYFQALFPALGRKLWCWVRDYESPLRASLERFYNLNAGSEPESEPPAQKKEKKEKKVSTRVPARALANPIARRAYSSTRLVPLSL